MLSEAIAMADAVGEGGSNASVLSDASESPSETEEPSPNDAEEPGPSETKESGSSETEKLGQSTCKRTHKRVRRVSNWKNTTRKRLCNTGQGYICTSKKVMS